MSTPIYFDTRIMMKIINISIWIIATLLTLYLFSTFDIWFMSVIHFLEDRITDNGDRILAAIPAALIAFMFSFLFCLLPMIGAIGISELYKRIRRKLNDK